MSGCLVVTLISRKGQGVMGVGSESPCAGRVVGS